MPTSLLPERGVCGMSGNEKTDNVAKLESRIDLLSIIGEVEGHEVLGERTKTTRYEQILPRLAKVEDDDQIEGLLILLNTVGGDVEAGLAIAEMIASLSKPTVSLVLGGGHSIGVPLAVSSDYSFIVPSATMVIHPVRTSGTFIGVMQSYRNMEKTQDRITGFIAGHSRITQERIEQLMLDTSLLVKDVGTMLDGREAVEEGLIDEVGGIWEALTKLHSLIDQAKKQNSKM
ncbi:MAG: ATP-dependent Clp protease proteolytic subunit [Clostridiales bacterium]|nr:ATP-dependent Clp protease proteolytic subunit [Clostridiales bacterium]